MIRVTTGEYVKEQLPPLRRDMNKFDRGRLFLVAGSYGMAGAAILAGRAALCTGVGFLHLAVPERIYPILAPALPEAVFSVYDEKDPASVENVLREGIGKANAVAAGCGLGALRNRVCPALLSCCDKPLLLDADGLNWMAEERRTCEQEKVFCRREESSSEEAGKRENFGKEPPGSRMSEGRKLPELLLTPHAGEMARLLAKTSVMVEEDRETAVREAEAIYREYTGAQVTVLLKGADTLIYRRGPEEELFRNPTGNPGMARAGSGDTLTGIIGALMAQGEPGFSAAVSGAYLHGAAGDLAAENLGIRSFLPTDLAERIPEVLRRL